MKRLFSSLYFGINARPSLQRLLAPARDQMIFYCACSQLFVPVCLYKHHQSLCVLKKIHFGRSCRRENSGNVFIPFAARSSYECAVLCGRDEDKYCEEKIVLRNFLRARST